ncbi:MAG: YbhB/YbcL family Raf kinase inhibitor-like protein [Chthoniobacterales bacterium]
MKGLTLSFVAVLSGTLAVLTNMTPSASAQELVYEATNPPLEITFAVEGSHYSGVVHPGSLFLQADISNAPVVKSTQAEAGAFYTLLMIDYDGNANGAWPDAVPDGANSPVRHWIVGNIPGETLRTTGYVESTPPATGTNQPTVLQPYRAPHIPMVSDRYGVYLFKQSGKLEFAEVTGPITNFDHVAFLKKYQLTTPIAANFFVAVYTSESPFSGKPFQGNDVTKTWHSDLGKGQLTPQKIAAPKN